MCPASSVSAPHLFTCIFTSSFLPGSKVNGGRSHCHFPLRWPERLFLNTTELASLEILKLYSNAHQQRMANYTVMHPPMQRHAAISVKRNVITPCLQDILIKNGKTQAMCTVDYHLCSREYINIGWLFRKLVMGVAFGEGNG